MPSRDKETIFFGRLIPAYSGSKRRKVAQSGPGSAVIRDGCATTDIVYGMNRGAGAVVLHEAMLTRMARAMHRTMVRSAGGARAVHRTRVRIVVSADESSGIDPY